LTVLAFFEGFSSAESGASLYAEAADLARKTRNPGVLAHALTQLGLFEVVNGELPKARSLLEEALSVTRESGNIFELARTTAHLGWTALYQGSFDEAENLLGECFEIGRVGSEYAWILARAFNGLAASWRGDYGRARELLDEAEALLAEMDNPFAGAMVRMTRGRAELASGDLAAADAHADQALGFFRPGGMKSMAAWCLSIIGEAALARGDLAIARTSWDESLALSRETKTAVTEIRSLQGLAALARAAGELHDSLDLLHNALRMIDEAGHTVLVADALEQLAGVLSVGQAFRESARLFGAAQALRERIGYVRSPLHEDTYEHDVSSVREALGPDEFASAWNQGLEMTVEDAVVYAARGRGRRLRPTAGWASLTPTELDVVRLVSEGHSNPEIAEKLFLARSTVKTHLLHVFAKLGVSSRAELAALVARRTK
jgi:ATP/maltotriose-dependent transcriptional regulator MalT